MSAQHTQGRMTVHTDGADGWPLLMIGGPAGRIVANVNTESGVDTTKAPSIAFKPMPATENARRLAACWNACEGLATDLLENIVMVGNTLRTRFEMRTNEEREMIAQRDALLAAARTMSAALDDLIAKKPMLAAAMAGSTTLGNQRVEFRSAIKQVEAAL